MYNEKHPQAEAQILKHIQNFFGHLFGLTVYQSGLMILTMRVKCI